MTLSHTCLSIEKKKLPGEKQKLPEEKKNARSFFFTLKNYDSVKEDRKVNIYR